MSKYLVIDLEMNQPSNTIIEIGYVVGDKTGRVFENESIFVKTEEQIAPYITDLTGISNELLSEKGLHPSLISDLVNSIIAKHNVSLKAITWGAGDVRLLLNQFPQINLHNRYLDMKTIYQLEAIANNKTMAKGLFNAATSLGINNGAYVAHRAKDDALVTYLVFVEYIRKFKKIEQTRKIWDT